MPLTRIARARAAARLIPSVPVIGVVVLLNAVGLGPVGLAGPRPS